MPADGAGLVIVQSFNPELPAIRLAAEHDYPTFAERELEERRRCSLPPYTRIARIVVRDAGPEDGIDFGEDFEPNLDLTLRALEVEVAWQDGVGMKTYALKSLRMAPEDF